MNQLSVYADSLVDDIAKIMLRDCVRLCTVNYAGENEETIKFECTTFANNSSESTTVNGPVNELSKKMESLIDDMYHGYEDGFGSSGTIRVDISAGSLDMNWHHHTHYLDSEPRTRDFSTGEWLDKLVDILSDKVGFCTVNYDSSGSPVYTFEYRFYDVTGHTMDTDKQPVIASIEPIVNAMLRHSDVCEPYDVQGGQDMRPHIIESLVTYLMDRGGHGMLQIDVDHPYSSNWVHFDYFIDQDTDFYYVHKDIQDVLNESERHPIVTNKIKI